MNLKDEYNRVFEKYCQRYSVFKEEMNTLNSIFEQHRNDYNAEIGIINSECTSMRDELRILYDFLVSIGGNLGIRISIFDFQKEQFMPESKVPLISQIEKPQFEEGDFWFDALLKTLRRNRRNKDMVRHLEVEIDNQYLLFDKQVALKQSECHFGDNAARIAEIYRNAVITVKDTVKSKIIPELSLIQAFLYADSIKEMVLDDVPLEMVEPNSIDEYEGTRYNSHYLFVKNTVDFYSLIAAFFRTSTLGDLLKKGKASEKDVEAFEKVVSGIEESINNLERNRVL